MSYCQWQLTCIISKQARITSTPLRTRQALTWRKVTSCSSYLHNDHVRVNRNTALAITARAECVFIVEHSIYQWILSRLGVVFRQARTVGSYHWPHPARRQWTQATPTRAYLLTATALHQRLDERVALLVFFRAWSFSTTIFRRSIYD